MSLTEVKSGTRRAMWRLREGYHGASGEACFIVLSAHPFFMQPIKDCVMQNYI
jgi:hypothetical protein